MSNYECPSCGGGFPAIPPERQCPWCGEQMNGKRNRVTPTVQTTPKIGFEGRQELSEAMERKQCAECESEFIALESAAQVETTETCPECRNIGGIREVR